ncbi:hypothetical protein A2U01_0070594, partial [Trifolium medium]|nr:hypothetical protein [Trifolium medium]
EVRQHGDDDAGNDDDLDAVADAVDDDEATQSMEGDDDEYE